MKRFLFIILFLFVGVYSYAHQFTPTYPKFQQSHLSGIVYTKMQLFNTRKDVMYYELSVFDSKWKEVDFATKEKVIPIKHLETKNIEIYIRSEDVKNVTYICTESLLKRDNNNQVALLSTKICSKIK